MRERSKKRLGEILIEAGALSKEELEDALAFQKKEGGLIGQILLKHHLISEENLIAALAQQLKIPYLHLASYSVNGDAVTLLDEEFCAQHNLLAFDHDEKRIFLAIADPLDEAALEEVERRTHLKVQVFISTPTEIHEALHVAMISHAGSKEVKKAG